MGANDALLARLFPGSTFTRPEAELSGKAYARLDSLAKPRGSLGRLEEIAARLFAISGGQMPLEVDPAVMFTVAADHGVAGRKVSPFPQAVTRQMVHNFLCGGAAINALCKASGMRLRVVDAGCAGGPFAAHPLLLDRRIGDGTDDIGLACAMSEEQCEQALRNGFELAENANKNGYACIGCGEMGIASTTAASALFCAFLNLTPDGVVGPGAGAGAEMLAHKTAIVGQALKRAEKVIKEGDPVAILAELGGFEIATLAGIMLGCASRRMPVLVDGFICAAAFTAACAIYEGVADYAFMAHYSAEPGFRAILAQMQAAKPLLELDMRLGEGSGCAIALNLLRASAAIFNEMATLSGAGVSARECDRLD